MALKIDMVNAFDTIFLAFCKGGTSVNGLLRPIHHDDRAHSCIRLGLGLGSKPDLVTHGFFASWLGMLLQIKKSVCMYVCMYV